MTNENYNWDLNYNEIDLIPSGTIVEVAIKIRRNFDNIITQSKTSDAKYIALELKIISGEYQGQKIFYNLGVSGSFGYVARGKNNLKSILRSAYNLKERERSNKLKITDFQVIDGLLCQIQVKVQEQPLGSNFPHKNDIMKVIVPEDQEYKVMPQLVKKADEPTLDDAQTDNIPF